MDEMIRKYVERALEAADRRDTELTDADLTAIARELGLTDEDVARIAQAVHDHVDRGRGYAGHQLWDDAIDELEDAMALAPSRLDIRIELANAFTGRWEATDYPDDKLRAEELARGVLDVDPKNQLAFGLLARLNPSEVSQPAEQTASPRVVSMLLVLLAVAGIGVGANLTLSSTPEQPEATPPPRQTMSPLAEPKSDTGEADLPVKFAGANGVTVEARHSRLARYPDRAFYTLWGDIAVTGELELENLDLRVKLLDADGGVIQTHDREAWGEHEATLRRGDHGFFTMLLDADPRAASVQLEAGLLKTVAAKGPYAESPVYEPKWEVIAPDHLQLEIRERHARFSKGIMKNKGFFKATWEFRNVGDVPIKALTYVINLYDGQGQQIESNRKLATFSSHPPIEPADVFLESTIVMTEASYARYEIVVTEIE